MDSKRLIPVVLPLVGGLNWGLVAAAELDLVAKLTGNRFGETSVASRIVYGAVGLGSVYGAIQLARIARGDEA
jgi:uncharacterized membrane protein YuzA (DUF378 family)